MAIEDNLAAHGDEEFVSEELKALVKARIHSELDRMHKSAQHPLPRATFWTCNVYALLQLIEEEHAPKVAYGGTFFNVARHIERRKRDAEAAQAVAEDDDDD